MVALYPIMLAYLPRTQTSHNPKMVVTLRHRTCNTSIHRSKGTGGAAATNVFKRGGAAAMLALFLCAHFSCGCLRGKVTAPLGVQDRLLIIPDPSFVASSDAVTHIRTETRTRTP